MIRSVWLALIFFVFICALAAFKVSIATPSKQQAALADDVVEQDAAGKVLPKGDRLADVPDKKTVRAVAIVPPGATPQVHTQTIASRHWRDSNARIKTRQHRRHHRSRAKHHRPHR